MAIFYSAVTVPTEIYDARSPILQTDYLQQTAIAHGECDDDHDAS